MNAGRRRACTAGVAAAAGALPGCALLARPSPLPLELIYDDRNSRRTQAPVLLVLLPGAHMAPAEMQREGMVGAVRRAGLDADVLIAGVGLEHVYDKSALTRLESEVFGPFSALGYRRLWLAGISLGGFLAMGYAQQHPGRVEGITAIAPYLGRQPVLQAIAQAGSPRAWARSTAPRNDDIDDRIWRWLAEPPVGAPALHLAYGESDRFAPAHRLLAGLLPASQVQVAPGGHDWPPWRTLWARWLAAAPLPRSAT